MEKTDKLDYKRTFFIGCAFFTIMLLWQVYNYTTPLFLEEMGINDSWKGIIMAADNLLALFMLPIFGMLSDKTKSRLGKRTPYIIVGTILAAITFPFIAVLAMKSQLVAMMITIALVLVFMNIYRSPAVALMPDLTPKKHRSVANGIINLMGGIGGIFAYGTLIFFFKGDTKIVPFIVASVLMIGALILLLIKVKEAKILEKIDDDEETKKKFSNPNPLTKLQKRNLIFILIAVFSWFFAVNAVETFWSVYTTDILGAPNESSGAIALLIFTVSAIAMYLPAGIIATKIGRKKTILIGIALILVAFSVAFIFREWNLIVMIALFVIAGLGWATINVNSYPMVVEMASGSNGGKFTGFYYTASMGAQTLTPIVIGFLMDKTTRAILFPYASVFLAIAFLFILFTDYKPHIKEK